MWEELPSDWNVVGVGDFNGDGCSDILLRNSQGYLTQWLGTVDGGFSDNGPTATLYFDPDWQVSGAGDINGDGRDDFLLRSLSGGWLTEWLGSNGGAFVDNGVNSTLYFASDWQVAGIGDFNGDGRDDFLLRNSAGYLTEWLGTANGSFNNNGPTATIYFDPEWKIAGIGDFNGDGKSDFILRHSNGQVTEWLGTFNGSFSNNGTNVSVALSNDWSLTGVGDFNGDGKSDLLWRHVNGSMTNWLGQSAGDFADNSPTAFQPLDLDFQVAGVGDFNGDGRSDVLLRSTNGILEIWEGGFDGTILSPMEKLWREAIADVAEFVDTISDGLNTMAGGSGSGGGSPSLTGYAAIFGPSFPNVNSGAFDTSNSNRNFTLNLHNTSGFSIFDDNYFGAIDVIDPTTGAYLFTVGSINLAANWYSGSPPSNTPADAIVITGTRDAPSGYFRFNAAGSGINFDDGFGGASDYYIRGGGYTTSFTHLTPGGTPYHYSVSLSAEQLEILDKIIDYGRSHFFSPEFVQIAVNQAYYESALGLLTTNPSNSDVRGLYQYDSATWLNLGHGELDRTSIADQIRAFYADLLRYSTRYTIGINNNDIPSSLNFASYMEIKHHLGNSSIDWSNAVVAQYNQRSAQFGFGFGS